MNRFLIFLLAISIVFQFPHQVDATSKLSGQKMWTEAKSLISQLKSADQILFVMALGGAPTESLKVIQGDLKKNIEIQKKFPEIELKNKNIMIDGKDSGVKIVSLDPLNITFKGKMWVRNRTASVEDNYFSLVEFLEGKKPNFSIFQVLIPHADAKDYPNANEKSSALVGAGLGLVNGYLAGVVIAIGMIIALPVAVTVVTATAAFTVGGYLIGKSLGAKKDKELSQFTSKMITSCPRITCDEKQVVLLAGDVSNQSKILIQKNGDQNSFEIYQNKNQKIPLDYVNEDQKRSLAQLAKCESKAQAQEITKQCEVALKAINGTAQKSGTGGSAPSSNQPNQNSAE